MPKHKKEKSFSLRKQSVMSVYTNESSKNLDKSKAERFIKLKAQF